MHWTLPQTSKKLVSVSATSVPVTDEGEEVVIKVPYIHYPVRLQEEQVRVLLNSGSKVNAMSPGYAKRLGLKA